MNTECKGRVMRIMILDDKTFYTKHDIFLVMDKDNKWLEIFHEKIMPYYKNIYPIIREVYYV